MWSSEETLGCQRQRCAVRNHRLRFAILRKTRHAWTGWNGVVTVEARLLWLPLGLFPVVDIVLFAVVGFALPLPVALLRIFFGRLDGPLQPRTFVDVGLLQILLHRLDCFGGALAD